MSDARSFPDLVLERFVAGDLSKALMREIEAARREDAALHERIEQIRREKKRFLEANPPPVFARAIMGKLERDGVSGERKTFGAKIWAWFLVPAVAMAAVVVVMIGAQEQITSPPPMMKEQLGAAPKAPAEKPASPAEGEAVADDESPQEMLADGGGWQLEETKANKAKPSKKRARKARKASKGRLAARAEEKYASPPPPDALDNKLESAAPEIKPQVFGFSQAPQAATKSKSVRGAGATAGAAAPRVGALDEVERAASPSVPLKDSMVVLVSERGSYRRAHSSETSMPTALRFIVVSVRDGYASVWAAPAGASPQVVVPGPGSKSPVKVRAGERMTQTVNAGKLGLRGKVHFFALVGSKPYALADALRLQKQGVLRSVASKRVVFPSPTPEADAAAAEPASEASP